VGPIILVQPISNLFHSPLVLIALLAAIMLITPVMALKDSFSRPYWVGFHGP
jgi:hypothetical protein